MSSMCGGFTKHESSGVKHRGTFRGLMEKIPYLKELGVNAVELMPIFEFDEMEDERIVDGKRPVQLLGIQYGLFFCAQYQLCFGKGIQPGRHGTEGTGAGIERPWDRGDPGCGI